jgi:hypothetical protein
MPASEARTLAMGAAQEAKQEYDRRMGTIFHIEAILAGFEKSNIIWLSYHEE